jgi:hypothetical protein
MLKSSQWMPKNTKFHESRKSSSKEMCIVNCKTITHPVSWESNYTLSTQWPPFFTDVCN